MNIQLMRRSVDNLLMLTVFMMETLCPAQGVWTSEPSTFRGAKFLTNESEVEVQFKLESCRDSTNDERLCLFQFDLGGVNVNGLLTFHKDRFVRAIGIFSPGDFDKILSIFSTKYGQTKSFPHNVHSWIGKAVSAKLIANIGQEDKEAVQQIASIRRQYLRDFTLDKFERDLDFAQQKRKLRSNAGFEIAKKTGDKYAFEENRRKAESNYEKDTKDAEGELKQRQANLNQSYDEFIRTKFAIFSFTVNEYAALLEQRSKEAKTKGVDAL